LALAAGISATEIDAAIREATQKLERVGQDATIIYDRSTQFGLRIYQRLSDGSIRTWQQTRQGVQLIEKRAGETARVYHASAVEVASSLSRRTSASTVGGVRLEYALDVLNALALRSEASETAVASIHGSVRLLSLKALLARIVNAHGAVERLDASTAHFGNISRIYGYVVDHATGDVVIIGTAGADGNGIAVEDVVTALKAVYVLGQTPSVSLDPDLANRGGPQTVRVGGVSSQSHFALVMAEADYAMKKIMFGTSPVESDSYHSAYDLLKAAPDPKLGDNRFWLSPVPPGPSDIQVAPSLDQALFSSGIQVLTESEEITNAGLTGTGTVEPFAQEAARSFTDHYGVIARRYPIFRSLEGLNDLVLLATVLRKAGVKEPVLEQLAAATLSSQRAGNVPKWYPGITRTYREEVVPGPPRRLVGYRISGGVNLRTPAASGLWARYYDRQLALLRERAQRLAAAGRLTLETGLDTLIVSAPRGARDAATLAIETGTRYLAQARFQEAEDQFSRAIADNEFAAEAFVGRAIAESALGKPRGALRDLRSARALEPDDERIQAAEVVINIETSRDLLPTSRPETIPSGVKSLVVDGLIERGRANHRARRFDDAIRDFSYAIRIDARNAKAFMYRGAVEIDMARFQFASDDLNQALRIEPNLLDAYLYRSQLRLRRRPDPDYLGAILDATTAVHSDPDNLVAYTQRALARIVAGRELQEALADASKLITLDPGFAWAYCLRAQVKWRMGDGSGADSDVAQSHAHGLDECKPGLQ
jgi:tetratricopeptide (TPR) repeat protein